MSVDGRWCHTCFRALPLDTRARGRDATVERARGSNDHERDDDASVDAPKPRDAPEVGRIG